ncbi:MAG: hypothetical protein QOF76_4736 [Solirubrobacteraceae bacterium]|jgi:hypothetical protein|nr:hypothetical protein [Solirubrobacteraceae bacterium]
MYSKAWLGAALALALPGAAAAAGCPTTPDPAALPSAAQLRTDNAFLAGLGSRPTGSVAQQRYIRWIVRHLRAIDGVRISRQAFPIDRWDVKRTALSVGSLRLKVAAPVPYSHRTPKRGVTAPLALVGTGTGITAENAAGKIIVRPAPAGTVPFAELLLPVVSWETYDPDHSFDLAGNIRGDFLAYNDRIHDLQAAKAAGAKAILFVKDLPTRQLRGHYEPYEGLRWGVPGFYLGADEGAAVTDAASRGATATVTLTTGHAHVMTPSIEAVVEGASPERIVIDSHTDGTNAVEDNGPIAMVAMARYLAALPAECRPRTVQFAFSTAHFFQRLRGTERRHGGAGVLADQLSKEYDSGTVAGVLVLEHLGAREYQPVARTDGGAGSRLALTGRSELRFIAITPSVPLVAAVDAVVKTYDLRRTVLLQGSDAPGATAPMHCNFGGEGTPYDDALLPTIGVISAPQSLYDPAFGLAGLDAELMHRELLAYTDLLTRLGTMSTSDIAGLVPAERASGAPACGQGA